MDLRVGPVVLGLLAAVLFGAGACGHSGGDEGETDRNADAGGGVETTIPEGDEYAFALSGAVESGVSGKGSGRNQRSGQTMIDFTGVAEDRESFSLLFTVDATEGTTGSFELAQTSQLTHGSTRYRTDTLDVAITTYEEGRLAGTLQGAFEERQKSGESYEALDPPLRIEGRFEFSYE